MNLLPKSLSKGFTMIELLVVIAIIGVLAAAVLAALNPIEQINRGRDTARQSRAAELVSGIDRFYAVTEEYPWVREGSTASNNAVVDVSLPAGGSDLVGFIGNHMVTNDEVKQTLIDNLEEEDLLISKPVGDNTTVTICFKAVSSAKEEEIDDFCSRNNNFAVGGQTVCSGAVGHTTNNWLCIP